MKAIFDTKPGSGYDDDVARRYHFPDRYLAQAEPAVGDWIAYREPRRDGGRSGYVAVARLSPDGAVRLGLDPGTADPEAVELLRLPKAEQERRIGSMLVTARCGTPHSGGRCATPTTTPAPCPTM